MFRVRTVLLAILLIIAAAWSLKGATAADIIEIDNNLVEGQTVSATIRVVGYAQIPNRDGYVDIFFNGTKIGRATYGTNRPEAGLQNMGYILDVDTEPLANGTTLIEAKAFTTAGAPVGTASRNVRINNLTLIGAIETPASGSTVSGGSVVLKGWALVSGGFKSLEMLMDGRLLTTLALDQARPDVLTAFPGYSIATPGYQKTVDLSTSAQGNHSLALVGVATSGRRRQIATSVFKLDLGLAMIGSIDSPLINQAQALTDPTVTISGWASSPLAVSKVRAYVNDRLVGETSYFTDRADIRALIPSNAYGSGYYMVVPNLTFRDGDNTLTVEITDVAGRRALADRGLSTRPSFNVTSGRRLVGAHLRPKTDYRTAIANFGTAVGKTPDIVMYFIGFKSGTSDTTFNTYPYLPTQIGLADAIPMITWETLATGDVVQPAFTLDQLNAGAYDTYISSFAAQIKAFGDPVLIRFDHEFNGDYYPWAPAANNNGNDPEKYIALWRRMIGLFETAGATNVFWVWAPNYQAPTTVAAPANDPLNYYPGDGYVDFIGVSAYNWGQDPVRGAGWQVPSVLFGNFVATMARSVSSKPILVSEIGTSPSYSSNSEPTWIGDGFTLLGTYSNVKGAVWFNDFAYEDNNGMDFRVATTADGGAVSADVTTAFKTAIQGFTTRNSSALRLPESGWWYSASEQGSGYALEFQRSSLFMAVYTYASDGTSQWYVSLGPMQSPTHYDGSLLAYQNGQTLSGSYRQPTVGTSPGTVALDFSSRTAATLTVGGRQIQITRFPFVTNGIALRGTAGYAQTGWWWNPSQSGTGYFIENQATSLYLAAYYYDSRGQATWYYSSAPNLLPTVFGSSLYLTANGPMISGRSTGSLTSASVGGFSLNTSAPDTGTVTLPNSTTVPLQRYRFQ
ncbi:MAG: hypothetical protein HY058_14415 [Proteobacteria bacterium]|nr:hypothetical protein [Pseudomonadota bacterium]